VIFKAPSSRGIVTKVFILLLLIGTFYIFAWQSGWWEENVVTRWEDRQSSEEGFLDSFKDLFSFEKLGEVGGFEDKKLKQEGIGVQVNSFRGTPTNTFNSGDPIGLVAEIDIGSLSEQVSEVSFMCRLQGYGNENNEADEVFPYDGIILPAYPDKIPTQTISCNFESGVTSIGGKDSREAELISSFENFFSKSSVNLYLITQDNENELGDDDPFTEYGWNTSGTQKTDNGRIVRSKYSPGPVKIPIDINYPQPFVSGKVLNPFLKVNIITDKRVNLDRVGEFRLYLPEDYIELVDNNCGFDLSNSYTDKGYVIYGLNQEMYSRLNEVCENKECYDDKREFSVGCYFEVKEFDSGPRRDEIRAEIWYDFEHISKTSVSIDDS